MAVPLTALAGAALLAQPPEEPDRARPQPSPTTASTPPPAPSGPSLQVCRSKVLTPPEKAYCCATYPQMKKSCM